MRKLIKYIGVINVLVIPAIVICIYLFFKVNIFTILRNQETLKIILYVIGGSYYLSSVFTLLTYNKTK